MTDDIDHVVLIVHGIRDAGQWQQMVATELKGGPIRSAKPVKYGYFDAVRFLLPFGFARTAPMERVSRELREARRQYPLPARISVVCHSFGTYLVTSILQDNPDISVWRLVLCGSVVDDNFRWDKITGQIGDPQHADKSAYVVNDCGSRDIWPVLGKAAGWGYGAVGTFGFGTQNVTDRGHDGGHGLFFREQFVRDMWKPFLDNGAITPTKTAPGQGIPLWLQYLGLLPLRYILALLFALALGGVAWAAAGLIDRSSPRTLLTLPEVVDKMVGPRNSTERSAAVRDLRAHIAAFSEDPVPLTGSTSTTSAYELSAHHSLFYQSPDGILKVQTYPLVDTAAQIRATAIADTPENDSLIQTRVYGRRADGAYRRIEPTLGGGNDRFRVAGFSQVVILTIYKNARMFVAKKGVEPILVEVDDLAKRIALMDVTVGGHVSGFSFGSVYGILPEFKLFEMAPPEVTTIGAEDAVRPFAAGVQAALAAPPTWQALAAYWTSMQSAHDQGPYYRLTLEHVTNDLLVAARGEFTGPLIP